MVKRKILIIISVVLMVAGAALISYPYVSNYLYQTQVDDLKEEWIDEMGVNADTKDPRLEELYEYLNDYNKKLFTNGQDTLVDPFSYSQSTVDLSDYGLKDNIIGFIEIDRIDVSIPIYLGANEDNMYNGAVHLTETSYPIGGENTNAVIAAHRRLRRSKMFRHIDEIQVGDEIRIVNFRETLKYKVIGTTVIQPDDIESIMIQPGKDMISLFSCHPYGYTYQRYVVYAQRVN